MNRIVATIVCSIALLASCQKAEEIDNPNEELLMSVEASIGNLNRSAESRYGSSDGTPNKLTFKSGNSIGVFVDNRSAIEWKKENDGSWTPDITVYWPDKYKPYNFYAYYPYIKADSKKSVEMPSLDGQDGTISSLSNCDFLVAVANQTYGEDGKVYFTEDNNASFKHVSSLISITVDGKSDLSTATIKTFSFGATNIASGTTYSFGDNEDPIVSIKEGKESNVLESADLDFPMSGEDHTFYFIVNSGVKLEDITFTIKYSIGTGENTVDYTASKQGLGASSELESGKQYDFRLNITDGVVKIDGSEIKNWGEGGVMDDIIINNPSKDGNEEA